MWMPSRSIESTVTCFKHPAVDWGWHSVSQFPTSSYWRSSFLGNSYWRSSLWGNGISTMRVTILEACDLLVCKAISICALLDLAQRKVRTHGKKGGDLVRPVLEYSRHQAQFEVTPISLSWSYRILTKRCHEAPSHSLFKTEMNTCGCWGHPNLIQEIDEDDSSMKSIECQIQQPHPRSSINVIKQLLNY